VWVGHVPGSFTDASRSRKGWLERAHSGTIFLDEIGEMTLRMQTLLLRFLETGEIQRLGSYGVLSTVNVRVISATNRNLVARIAEKSFREDLFYRLNVIHIVIPPLRERREDIPVLVRHFLGAYSDVHRIEQPRLLEETMAGMKAYDWPGNVRELRNVVERLVVRARSSVITPADLPREMALGFSSPPMAPRSYRRNEWVVDSPGASRRPQPRANNGLEI
jgi:two-component system, NtrC family, response regulator AtoC